MQYLYLDTEFNRKDFTPRGLVSIALVTEDASYYAVNNDMDISGIANDPEVGPWMTEHVLEPHIPHQSLRRLRQTSSEVRDFRTIGKEVDSFLRNACPSGDAKEDIRVIVNCGSQDMVRLHTVLANNDWGLFGAHVPLFADDMARWKHEARLRGLADGDLPCQPFETVHHALYDAEHEMITHQYLLERFGKM